MSDKRIQINTIVNNQLPAYVREEFPLVVEFLSQYYIAQEFKGSSIDLIQNIDKYVKLDESTKVDSSEFYLYSMLTSMIQLLPLTNLKSKRNQNISRFLWSNSNW